LPRFIGTPALRYSLVYDTLVRAPPQGGPVATTFHDSTNGLFDTLTFEDVVVPQSVPPDHVDEVDLSMFAALPKVELQKPPFENLVSV
jgi:hypothetical protein